MSSLNYLKDNDIIQKLEGYVLKAYLKKKKKDLEDARDFHINCVDINKINHYLISDVISKVKNDNLWSNLFKKKFTIPQEILNNRMRSYLYPDQFLQETPPEREERIAYEMTLERSWNPSNMRDNNGIYITKCERRKNLEKLILYDGLQDSKSDTELSWLIFDSTKEKIKLYEKNLQKYMLSYIENILNSIIIQRRPQKLKKYPLTNEEERLINMATQPFRTLPAMNLQNDEIDYYFQNRMASGGYVIRNRYHQN